jgi:hypothetical protein
MTQQEACELVGEVCGDLSRFQSTPCRGIVRKGPLVP